MIKIENIDDLMRHLDELPSWVVGDINRRISDWLSSGGKPDDPYIKQQYKFAENVINAQRRENQARKKKV